MGQKTNNRILWHGNGLNAEGKAVAPVKAVAGGDGTDGLNEGELYICNSDSDPALFILTDAGNVVRIDGNGSDTYTREQINEKLNAKVDVAFFSRMFGLMDEEGGEIQVNDVETLASSIKAKLGFWTEQYLSAKGKNPDSGSEVSGATTLAALTDVSITTTPKDGQVLAYDATLNKWTPVDMEATAGIDEEELLQILTQKGYATQQWVTQQSYAKTSVRIIAGTGLTGGGTLAQDVTLSLATVGTAGTYTKVTVDSYGRVTGHSTLTQGDIPALAISKITGLQTALDAKLNKSVFEELFEKVWVSGYGYAIRAKLAFYSEGWISAKGLNSDAGSTTGGVDEDEVLQIVENAGYIKSSALNGYATQSWVTGLGYMSQGTADGRYFRKNAGQLGNNSDLNDATVSGLYFVSSDNPASLENYPASYGYSVLANMLLANGRGIQLMMVDGNEPIYLRTSWNTNTWRAWRALLDNTNYANYTVTKTGGGASGTWGIGISGNAASATKLQTARTLWGQSFNGTENVSGDMTGVGNISASGTVYANAFRLNNSKGRFFYDELTNAVWLQGGAGLNMDISNHGGSTIPTLTVHADVMHVAGGMYADGGMELPYSSGTWLSMATRTALLYGADAQSNGGAHALFRVTANNGGVLAFGGLGNEIGFFGFSKSNIDNGTNAYSFRAAFNMSNYEFATNQGISAGTYVQVGSARLYYDSSNNALYVQKSDGTQCGFYATGFVSAKGANDDGGDTEATVLTIADERNTAIYPDTYAGRGIRGLFRANATDGLNDGGTFHTVLHIRQWANSSGGLSHQLAFTDNGGVWHRTALSETAWGEWSELSALSGLDDVSISNPVDGQALIRRNGVWRNETVSGGGSAAVNWDDIQGKPTWIPDTDGSGSDIDADLLDGTHKSGLFTAMTYSGSTLSITIGGTKRTATINASGGGASSVSVSSSSIRNISVTVDGHTDYVNDVYATYSTYADQLRTARTIWGQSFNGGGSVSGAMSGVTNINMSGTITLTGGCTIHNNTTRGGIVMTYNGNDDGACLVIEADCVRRGWKMDTYALGSSLYRWHTIYSVNSLNTSSDLRLKDILSDIPLTVEDVGNAPSFLYRWKNGKDGRAYAGSSAQYWQQALPQAVTEGADGYLAMEYDRIALAAAITTARTVVDHEQRIRKLEQQLLNAV